MPVLRFNHLSGLMCAVLLLAGGLPLIGNGIFVGKTVTAPGSLAAAKATSTPLVTVTPQSNGCTVHVVGSGQTLWSIALAYGVKVDEIRSLNGIAPDSTTIYIGQKLFVRCVTATPASQPSATAAPPTDTPIPTKAVATATLAQSSIQTQVGVIPSTSVQESSAIKGPSQALFAGVMILAGGTLVVLLAFALIKRQGS
jgi:LysM repeat protein